MMRVFARTALVILAVSMPLTVESQTPLVGYDAASHVRCQTWIDKRNEQGMPTEGAYVQGAVASTCEALCNANAACAAFDFLADLSWCRTFTDCKGANLLASPSRPTWYVYTKIERPMTHNEPSFGSLRASRTTLSLLESLTAI